MYHYTESGLQNVWLVNGYTVRKTPYGKGVSIHDVEGLHRLIGRSLAQRPHLTGAELRFLRKEMGMSQSGLAALLGTSEQNISLWERRGRIPKTSDRFVRLIYLEHIGDSNQKIRELVERLNALDQQAIERLEFAENKGKWKEAA
jgi:DNA-binding transcriptional regulator YiaG